MAVPAHLDFATEGPPGSPGLIVEAKRIRRSAPEWARDWRRNLLRHEPEGLTDVILALVTLERVFVWPTGADPDALPSFVFDTLEHLGAYFRRVKAAPGSMSPRGFEELVSWWLEDLTDPQRVARLPEHQRGELERSGMLAALQGAQVVEGSLARW